MMKKIGIIVICILLIAGIGVGIFLFINKQKESDGEVMSEIQTEETVDSKPVGAILENSRLTEDEKTLTGVWESEDGWILGVRERALADSSFALDAIIYCPAYDEWFKVTREDGSCVSDIENGMEFSDCHDCPAPDDSGMMEETKEELIYDQTSDTITYTCYSGGMIISWLSGTDTVDSIIFHRTDKDITEAEAGWDWYYDIEGDRDPR